MYKRVDLPSLRKQLSVKNEEKLSNVKATDFLIVKKYGQGFKLDSWRFPKAWKDIYPFNYGNKRRYRDNIMLKKIFQIILEIKEKNNKVIFANNLKTFSDQDGFLLMSVYVTEFFTSYSSSIDKNSAKVIVPLLESHIGNSSFEQSEKFKFSTTQMINIDNIPKIKNFTIELEQK